MEQAKYAQAMLMLSLVPTVENEKHVHKTQQ